MSGILKTAVATVFLGIMSVGGIQASYAGDDHRDRERGDRESKRDSKHTQQFVFNIRGTSNGYACTIPPTDRGTTQAECFDADIYDLKTGELVGSYTDALADIDVIGTGFSLTGTTTFHLPLGDIVTRDRLALPATNIPIRNVTHLTGIIPEPGKLNILSGTGKYAGVTGQSRLSGAVDMSTPGVVGWNCIFVIDAILPRK